MTDTHSYMHTPTYAGILVTIRSPDEIVVAEEAMQLLPQCAGLQLGLHGVIGEYDFLRHAA